MSDPYAGIGVQEDPYASVGAADPAYNKAMDQLRTQDAQMRAVRQRFGTGSGLSDWESQVARNTGAMDEVAGAANYLAQGTKNIFRNLTGQPIEVPAATAAKAAMDYERQQRGIYAQQHPGLNAAATGAMIATSATPTGGAAGLITNPFKAGLAAAAQRAPFAVAGQTGDLKERLPGAALDTAMTFGTGAALTAAGNIFSNSAAKAAANPSAARQLSDQGVDLTPGQMAGGFGRRVEDMATSLPITGAAVNGARNRGIESFNRAAIDQSLAPIGQSLPRSVDVGREGLKSATGMISDAYNSALQGVKVTPDAQYAEDISQAVKGVPESVRGDLDAIVQDATQRMGSGVSGADWKAVDADLGAAYRAADNASQNAPVQRFLRDAIGRVRDAHTGLLARIDPAAAAKVQAADQATANLVRIRQASQNAATASRAGVFTPAELNRAALSMDTSAGNRAFATGQATMQNLTDPAMQVLPNKVADSGTAGRLMSMGAVYGGTGMLAGPHTGLGALATDAALSMTYSKPVMAAVNAVYRATSPGQAQAALGALAKMAARDPAVQPAYQAALRRLGVAPSSISGQPQLTSAQPQPTTP